MIRMTPKRALFLVRPGLPAWVISQVTVTGLPVGAVTETTFPAVPSSSWTAWPSCSSVVGGRPLVVVVAAGGAVVSGVPNAPVVTVGAGFDPPPVNMGTTRASTITTTAPMSSSPTGCRHHGGGLPGGCGSGCRGGWGGCCGGCSTAWVSLLIPSGPTRTIWRQAYRLPRHKGAKSCGSWTMSDQKEAVGPEPGSVPASASGASATGAAATGAVSAGFTAVLALAVGAAAIGAVAIGRLVIRRAVIRHLRVDELEVGRLRVGRLEVTEPG